MKCIAFVVVLMLVVCACYADRCSYSHCYKEELHRCKDTSDRNKCVDSGGLYITYREGVLPLSKHKCCQWRLEDLPNKHLYCVRNIRSSTKKCTSEGGDYDFKYKTQDKCVTFACNNL